MGLAHGLAAQAVDGRNAQKQPGSLYALAGLNDVRGIKALVKLFQHLVIAAFQAHIHNAKPQPAQHFQFLGGLAQNTVG